MQSTGNAELRERDRVDAPQAALSRVDRQQALDRLLRQLADTTDNQARLGVGPRA